MRIIVDLDGTICTEEKTFSRSLAKLLPGAKEAIQELYNSGYYIIIYSARTWMEYEMTYDWLKRHEIPFHQLVLGKPIGDFWIDDRALSFKGNWNDILNTIKKK